MYCHDDYHPPDGRSMMSDRKRKKAVPQARAVSAALRERLLRPGVLRADVARATGLSESSLSRFVRNGTGLSMASIDRLARHFGLSLTETA